MQISEPVVRRVRVRGRRQRDDRRCCLGRSSMASITLNPTGTPNDPPRHDPSRTQHPHNVLPRTTSPCRHPSAHVSDACTRNAVSIDQTHCARLRQQRREQTRLGARSLPSWFSLYPVIRLVSLVSHGPAARFTNAPEYDTEGEDLVGSRRVRVASVRLGGVRPGRWCVDLGVLESASLGWRGGVDAVA